METTVINITNGYTDDIVNTISSAMIQNKIIILPCDTIYGISALPNQDNAVRQVKKRDSKPFIYLISDIKQLSYFDIDYSKYSDVLLNNWPGNITFIMQDKNGTTYGVRMPNSDYLKKIIDKVNIPIISTSVNFSGEAAMNTPNDIVKQFSGLVDLIITDYTYEGTKPSTIVDITSSSYKILRQGERIFKL